MSPDAYGGSRGHGRLRTLLLVVWAAGIAAVAAEMARGGFHRGTLLFALPVGRWIVDRASPPPWPARTAFTIAVVERLGDAAILGAIAWAMRGSERVSAAAVAALVLWYIAAYAQVRAAGLGFAMDGTAAERLERYWILALGFLVERPEPALWVFAALAAAVAARRSQIAWRTGART